jgi:anti-anti-sigma factor
MPTTKTTFSVHRATGGRALGVWPPTRVEVNGDLDLGSVVDFRLTLGDLVGDPSVTIDLSGCGFVDSAGIGALVGVARRLRDTGSEVAVVGARPSVLAALRVARVGTVLDLPTSRDTARHIAHAA